MTWTLKSAAAEFAIHPDTLKKRLVAASHEIGRGQRYTTLQIYKAMVGDKEAERTGLIREQREQIALENAKTRGELIAFDAAKKIVAEALAPVRSKLMALPPTLSIRVNPSDPEMARAEIELAVEEILKGAQC